MPSGTEERRHQLTDECQQDLDVVPDHNRGTPDLFNDRQWLSRPSCRRLWWALPIEIKKTTKLFLEPPDRHAPTGPVLVLLKFEDEGDTSAVAVTHA